MENNKKNFLIEMGFDKEVNRINQRLCPFCANPIQDEDFRDELSKRESKISGLCQKCQDEMFGR